VSLSKQFLACLEGNDDEIVRCIMHLQEHLWREGCRSFVAKRSLVAVAGWKTNSGQPFLHREWGESMRGTQTATGAVA
jgi:hypothetical protein